MIKVATRDSQLSVAQTKALLQDFSRYTDVGFELLPMTTAGDQNLQDRFDKIDGRGVFTKELDQAVLDRRADIAVHSLKDLPSIFPPGIALKAVGLEEDMRDALVSTKYTTLDEMPAGAKIGTSSARRVAQLACYYPKLQAVPMRGNLQTRLRKMAEQNLDGMILATSGLVRMGYQGHIKSYLPIEQFVPAIGQGYLAVTARMDKTLSFFSQWQDAEVWNKVASLRHMMQELDGGCSIPLGICWDPGANALRVFLSNRQGSNTICHAIDFEQSHRQVAAQMMDFLHEHNVRSLIEDIRNGS